MGGCLKTMLYKNIAFKIDENYIFKVKGYSIY